MKRVTLFLMDDGGDGHAQCYYCKKNSLLYMVDKRRIYCDSCDVYPKKNSGAVKLKNTHKFIESEFGGVHKQGRFLNKVTWEEVRK